MSWVNKRGEFPPLRLAPPPIGPAPFRKEAEAQRADQLLEAKLRQQAYRDSQRATRRAPLIRHHANKRRAAKLARTPPWADEGAIRDIYDEAARLTRETGEMHHVDHVVPLQGKLVSGLHVENNLQILHWRGNVTKHNKFEVEA